MIRAITEQDDFAALARVLNAAFAAVAQQFGLTRENAPTNNAFISGSELRAGSTENREFYVYEADDGEFVG